MGHADLPEELADLLRPLRRRATLGPVAALTCDRREFALRDDHGTTLALLRDDKVTVRRGGLTTARYREVMITPVGPGHHRRADRVAGPGVHPGRGHVRAPLPAAGPPARRAGHRPDRPAGARAVRRRRAVQEVRAPSCWPCGCAGSSRPTWPSAAATWPRRTGWPTRRPGCGTSSRGCPPVLDPEWVEDLYDELGWISLDSAPSDDGRSRAAGQPAAQRALPDGAGTAGRGGAGPEAGRGPGRAHPGDPDRAGRHRAGPAAAVPPMR